MRRIVMVVCGFVVSAVALWCWRGATSTSTTGVADAGSRDGIAARSQSQRRPAVVDSSRDAQPHGTDVVHAPRPTTATSARLARLVSTLTDDPDAKLALATRMREEIELAYGPLLDALELHGDARTLISDLLVERRFMDIQCALRRLDPSTSVREREALQAQWRSDLEEWQGRLNAQLGSERAEVYEQYVESLPARQQVALFQQSLATHDKLLTESQAQQILDLVHEVQQQYPLTQEVEDPLSANPEAFDAQTLAQYERDLEACRKTIVTKANSVLDHEQLALLDELLAEDARNRQNNLNMGLKLLNDDETP